MKRRIGIAFFSVFVLGQGTSVCAQQLSDAARADSLFKAEQYQQAISIWSELASSAPDAGLYYNIGIAYSHLQQTAEAIYAFEQGLRFEYSDEWLRRELKRERKQIRDSVIPLEPFFLSRWFYDLITALRPGTWSLFGLVFLFMVVLHGLAANRIIPLRHFSVGPLYLWLIVPGLLMLCIALVSFRHMYRENEAIVMTSCEIRQAPAAESPSIRILSPGEKVVLRDHIGEWYQVSLANLDYGWIQNECARIIQVPVR